MSDDAFRRHYVQERAETPKSESLRKLAGEYHRRCEAFDRTVCTRREGGRAVAANAYQLWAINGNSTRVLWHLFELAEAEGFTMKDLLSAIREHKP